ncbi:TRAP transporter small permease subunit [Flocculibacter collagenilyticus]|uniref:TRAP transporter small permease subunit n=1 Tax=Flocculibacter collagenilyticus TaxID=2744479 RepID=UPI0018F34FE9|nr:TRAP transporter small permease subunit [Flocculibacter collagenilyticus]
MGQQLLLNIRTRVEQFTEYTGKLLSWLTLLMMLLMVLVVVLRYGFNMGWIAMQESIIYLHACVFMLGAAYTLKHDEHVRVDIFYRRFSKKNQAIVNILGTALFLIPVCITLLIISWQYVAASWQLLESSKEAGGLPLVFILKSFIIGFVITLLIQAVAELIKHTTLLFQKQQ